MEKALISTRRYDLDWLRVIAFSLLILYHCGMGYVQDWGWHVKNPDTSESFQLWMLFVNRWRMALLFMISGAGVWFSMKRRTPAKFAGERFTRLFIPLAFGMLFIVPPQIYFERLTQGVHFDNYWQFQLSVFQFVPYPDGGSLSWHHLWYLPYILVYSLLCLPFFLYWRSEKAARVREKLQATFAKYPWLLFAVFLLPGIAEGILQPYFPTTHNLTHDWANFTSSLLVFLIGYILASHIGFIQTISKYRKTWLGVALVLVTILYAFYWLPDDVELSDTHRFFYRLLNAANAWAWLLAILGFGYRYLNFNTPFLQYTNQAVYPFYILHQTITITLVYYMLDWQVGVLPKFAVAVIGTFGISFLLYEFIIRRIRLLYPFFGLKGEQPASPTPQNRTNIALETAPIKDL
ncbi:MAG: acyltransferase family protein [Saprospiraceae bacterium]